MWRGAVPRLARVGVLIMSVIVAVAASGAVDLRPATADEPAEVAQEVSLADLTIGSITVPGSHGVAEAFFPPPPAPVASDGSFARVFFEHSSEVGSGSNMQLAFNDQVLLEVPLGRGTSAGGVVETRLPDSLIQLNGANRLRIVFNLVIPPAVPANEIYARVNEHTMIHYRLAVPPTGVPGLETYPHSLLGTAIDPEVQVVLPSDPSTAEESATFRLLADLGRRASRRVTVSVVPLSQSSVVDSRGTGLIAVGRLDRLPTAAAVLAADGWHQDKEGWTAPDGTRPRSADGIVAMALSPWDRRTPLLVATGATDEAVSRAVSALVDAAPTLNGPYAVSSATTPTPPSSSDRKGSVEFTVPSAAQLVVAAGGTYQADISFPAPPTDPSGTSVAELAISMLGLSANSSFYLNGTWVGGLDLVQSGRLVVSFPARLLRTGMNSLSVTIKARGVEPGVYVPNTPTTISATVQLPGNPTGGPDLRSLPYPFLTAERPTRLILSNASVGELNFAASVAIALGQRSLAPPGPLEVALADNPNAAAGESNLIVLGVTTDRGTLAQIGRSLPASISKSGVLVLSGNVRPPPQLVPPVGLVQEVVRGSQTVLWFSGSGDAHEPGLTVLYERNVGGPIASVDGEGNVAAIKSRGRGNEDVGRIYTVPGLIVSLLAALSAVLLGATMAIAGYVIARLDMRRRRLHLKQTQMYSPLVAELHNNAMQVRRSTEDVIS
jgi:Bacterial cellulose synthase subunit